MHSSSLISLAYLPAPLHLYRAERFHERLMGVWRRPLAEHQALWLLPCLAVHTLGLRASLDILFLDVQGRLLRQVDKLAPNRCVWHWAAHSVVELPGGYCQRHPRYRLALRQALQQAAAQGNAPEASGDVRM